MITGPRSGGGGGLCGWEGAGESGGFAGKEWVALCLVANAGLLRAKKGMVGAPQEAAPGVTAEPKKEGHEGIGFIWRSTLVPAS
jgi:hypothetical protein